MAKRDWSEDYYECPKCRLEAVSRLLFRKGICPICLIPMTLVRFDDLDPDEVDDPEEVA